MALRALARVAYRQASFFRTSALLPPRRLFSSEPDVEEQRFLQALKENKSLYPEDHQLIANSYGELARYYSSHNKPELVLANCKEQFNLLQKVRPEPWTEMIEVGRLVIELLYSESKYEECEKVALKLVSIAQSAYGPSNLEVARARFMIAHLREQLGKMQEAEEDCNAAAAIVKRHPEPEFLAAIYQNLANLKKMTQDFSAAEAHIAETLKVLEESKSPEKDEMITAALTVKADIFAVQGRFDEAENEFKSVIALRKAAKKPNKVEIANCLNNLGMIYLNTNRIPEAEATFKEKLEVDRSVFPEVHPSVANSFHNLAAVEEAKGNLKGAKENFQKALEIRKQTLGDVHPHIAVVHQNLVELHLALRELDEAEEHAKQAVYVGRNSYPGNHPFMGTAFFDLGMVQELRGKLQESMASHISSLEIREKSLPPTHPDIGSSCMNLGHLSKKLNQIEKANEYYAKGYTLLKTQMKEDNPDLATVLNNMGSVNFSRGDFAGAEEDIRKSLTLRLRTADELNPAVVTTRGNLAAVLLAAGKSEAAEKELRKCLEAVEARPGETGATPEMVAKLLYGALRDQQKHKEAIALAKKYNIDS